MTTVQITTPAGKADGTVELPAEIFDVQSNIPLMHQVVVAQLAAARQGTHKTKTRGEVSGGGKKPYRQKGTGRARQGSTRAPQFVGGGIVARPGSAPVPAADPEEDEGRRAARRPVGPGPWRQRPRAVRLVDGDAPSTKTAIAALAAVSSAKNMLVVIAREDENGWRSLRNAPEVHLIAADQLNTYDVLVTDDVVFTRAALERVPGLRRAVRHRHGHRRRRDQTVADETDTADEAATAEVAADDETDTEEEQA